MQTIILPGYSIQNKEWLETCAKKIKTNEIVRPIYWDHWTDSTQKFDAKEKAWLISRHARDQKINIIAKSVGILVASLVIENIPNQINKIIVCGIPINDINDFEKAAVKKSLESLDPSQLMCIQNNLDPHGNCDEVKKEFSGIKNFVCKIRNDHNYPYFEELSDFITK